MFDGGCAMFIASVKLILVGVSLHTSYSYGIVGL